MIDYLQNTNPKKLKHVSYFGKINFKQMNIHEHTGIVEDRGCVHSVVFVWSLETTFDFGGHRTCFELSVQLWFSASVTFK